MLAHLKTPIRGVRWATSLLVALGVCVPSLRAAPAPAPVPTAAASPARRGSTLDPAKKAEALKHLRAGLQLYNAGEYQKAIGEYQKAYKLYPSPKLYPNIGSAYKYMGQNLKAIGYYERFLAETEMDSADPSIVRLRRNCRLEIKTLLKRISLLRVVVKVPGAKVKIGGRLPLASPVDKRLRFNPGRVSILVKKKGFYPFDRTVELKAGAEQVVRVLLLKKIKPKVVIKVKPGTPIYKRWWFWTAIGALVAGGVTATAVVLGSRTEEKVLSGDLRLNHNSFNVRF